MRDGEGSSLTKNIHLDAGSPVRLTAGQRFDVNMQVLRILYGKTDAEITEDDRNILRQYTGWGGLAAQLAKPEVKDELTAMYGESAYRQFVNSVANAHYTDYPVIKWIYTKLAAMGFKGGYMLDARGGIGNFTGVAPKGYKFDIVELEPITARIANAEAAFLDADISPRELRTELLLTEYGERMALSFYLPELYNFDPGDGHPMELHLTCLNSVDGSSRFRALMGWHRLVCSNGLTVNVTQTDLRRRHLGHKVLDDISEVLNAGLREFENERRQFDRWYSSRIDLDQISQWADRDVQKRWGYKAAARTFHIARTGFDVEVSGSVKEKKPSDFIGTYGQQVPGSPQQCRNLYHLGQILAWIAMQRRDIQEQVEWRDQIRPILTPFLN